MKAKKLTIGEIYHRILESELRLKQNTPENACGVYFGSYYLNKFIQEGLSIKSYIGIKKADQTKDMFVLSFSLQSMQNKNYRKVFRSYFTEVIKGNERYIGILKNTNIIGFVFKHDDELLNAYKTGNYSKISELKKKRMKNFRMQDYDIKIRTMYFFGDDSKLKDKMNYPLSTKDKLKYLLFKMIYPEFFYNILSEQFDIKQDYLRKNHVQILPPANFENEYLELNENDSLIFFEKKN